MPSSSPSASTSARWRGEHRFGGVESVEQTNIVDEATDIVALDDVGDVTADHDSTPLEDRDAITQVVELSQDVRRDDHGGPLLSHLLQDAPQVGTPAGVESVGGLVQDQKVGLVQQAAPDEQPLPHALGQRAAGRGRLGLQPERGQDVIDGRLHLRATQLEAAREELKVLARGHVLVQRVAVAQESDAHADGAMLVFGFELPAVVANCSVARLHDGGHNAKGGRLAGPVGTDKAHDRTARHGERHVVHRPRLAVVGF